MENYFSQMYYMHLLGKLKKIKCSQCIITVSFPSDLFNYVKKYIPLFDRDCKNETLKELAQLCILESQTAVNTLQPLYSCVTGGWGVFRNQLWNIQGPHLKFSSRFLSLEQSFSFKRRMGQGISVSAFSSQVQNN